MTFYLVRFIYLMRRYIIKIEIKIMLITLTKQIIIYSQF